MIITLDRGFDSITPMDEYSRIKQKSVSQMGLGRSGVGPFRRWAGTIKAQSPSVTDPSVRQ